MLDELLDEGEELQVTYQYPTTHVDEQLKTRTDRLLAVEPENKRLFVSFMGQKPVWIERHEVIAVERPTVGAV